MIRTGCGFSKYFWQCLYLIVFHTIGQINAVYFPNMYPKLKLKPMNDGDAGSPLMITPYLENGAINLAQNLSRVSITEDLGIRSHAGFFTINKTCNANLYFWYFPPFSNVESAPVILWLQGGPGGSSLYGLFTEIDPILVEKEQFVKRKYHWALYYHLIFIDNPVGTGFSFTDLDACYCSTENCVAQGLYAAMEQFFKLFPRLDANDFYLAGESYAGKYIPSLAMAIHQNNGNKLNKKMNMKGLVMGNAYCDPINQLDYGNYLYQHGLIDDNQLKIFLKYQAEIANQIQQGHWMAADLLMDRLMDGEVSNTSYFKSFTGFSYYYNFLQSQSDEDDTVFANLLQNETLRRSVHVGGLPFNDGEIVQRYLASDLLQSIAPLLTDLLNHYNIMFYNGQLDIVVSYPLTVNFLRKLNFSGSEEYKTAPRHIWRVDDEVAGYIKKAGRLTEVLIRNAGHMVPRDQPKWMLDLLGKFINKKI